MINSVIACLFLFVFGAVLFVVNATAPFCFLWGAEGNGRAVSNIQAGSDPGAWCPSTKEEGLAGSKAPRQIGGRPVRTRGRGAR